MKRFLAILALAALAFVGCGDDTTNQTNANLEIKITEPSNGILSVSKEGGNMEIKYSLVEADETRSAAPMSVAVTCSADWISNITTTNNSIKFEVAENTDRNREDTMIISYGSSTAIVMVQQEGVIVADVVFKATHLGGSYFGKFLEPVRTYYNYFVILGDKRADHYQSKQNHATEYRFDIYSDVSSAFNKTHRIPVGTYKLDHSSSGRAGTIDGYVNSSYLFDANDNVIAFADAELTVTEDSITAMVTFFDGQVHRVEYTGSTFMEDYIQETYADVSPVSQYTEDIKFNVTGGSINARFRGDYYGTGCDVWFMDMVEKKAPYNGTYLIFDLIIPKSGGFDNLDAIVGEYTLFEQNPESYEYTIPTGRLRDDSLQLHAWYINCVNSQVDMSTAAPLTSGTVKVTKDGSAYKFEVNSTDDNGNKIIGTFSGFLSELADQSL